MRYMIYHPVAPNTTVDDLKALGKKLPTGGEIRPIRSFFNVSEGKAVCIFEAPDRSRLENWLREHELPYDEILEVELEGEAGTFTVLHEPAHKT